MCKVLPEVDIFAEDQESCFGQAEAMVVVLSRGPVNAITTTGLGESVFYAIIRDSIIYYPDVY